MMLKDFVSKLRKANEEGLCPPQDWTHHAIKIIESLRRGNSDLQSKVEQLTETVSLLTTEGENRLQTIQQLTQERDEWMQQAEHRREIIRDRKAQVQKYKDKLTRCSAMFDEVEDSLADSCRREGKLKETVGRAIESIEDIISLNPNNKTQLLMSNVTRMRRALQAESKEETMMAKIHIPTEKWEELRDLLNSLTPHEHAEGRNECYICDEPIIDAAIREIKSHCKEDICPGCNGNNKDMPCAYPSEGMKGCLRDKKDMVLVPREDIFKLEQARLNLYALFPEADTNLIVNLSYVSGPMWKITKGRLPVKIKAAEDKTDGKG